MVRDQDVVRLDEINDSVKLAAQSPITLAGARSSHSQVCGAEGGEGI